MTPPAPPLLRLEGVARAFGEVEALRRLSLEVREGEVLSLLGPSGCGKSTALRLMAGLDRPDAGRLLWRDGPPGPSDLGVVFQDPTLMPWATVERNVWLPLRLRGQSLRRARSRVAEVLALVGLEGFAGAYPRELSGGMRMRAALARALVTAPRLLLMDEPFAALDEVARQRLNDLLLSLRDATGATIVFVTHSVLEAAFLSSRILVMTPRPGRVVREIAPPPGPRDRASEPYARLAREASEALREAVSPGPRA